MLPQIVLQEFASDCQILLNRALLGKTVSCFGADGNGLYGTHHFAKHFDIANVRAQVHQDSDENLTGVAMIILDGYDSQVDGHVATDVNLKISVNKLLAAEYIDTSCWSWADIAEQGDQFFTINFNVNKLLGY